MKFELARKVGAAAFGAAILLSSTLAAQERHLPAAMRAAAYDQTRETVAMSGDGSGANTFAVSETSPPDTFQFTAYIVNQNTVLLVGSHTNGKLIIGRLVRQP